ncbi:MAG: hypothetical protein K2Q18_00855 [Bdellovibrionales bacterium]|nr:hypothetical protein [Bdellovibrionales bacterium]
MSPELKNYYSTKQRRKAFYIAENELNNKENPPVISAVIGLDKELEEDFYATRRPPVQKAAMKMGIRVNRNTNKVEKENKTDKEEKEIGKKKHSKKNGIQCPSLPTQWKNNFNIIIPRAEFT